MTDDSRWRQRRIRREEVLVAVRARLIADEHPADRHQTRTRLVPAADPAGMAHASAAATVPADLQGQ